MKILSILKREHTLKSYIIAPRSSPGCPNHLDQQHILSLSLSNFSSQLLTGTDERSGMASLIKETITLAWLRSYTLYFPTKVAHVLCQCKPSSTTVRQRSIQCLLSKKLGQEGRQGQTGGCDGHLYCSHSPGLEEPSLILMGFAKLTRIVRPKSSDSF